MTEVVMKSQFSGAHPVMFSHDNISASLVVVKTTID